MKRLGIVDLGSGTSRLVVFAYREGEQFRLIDEIREPVRLGEGLGRHGQLSAEAMERALSALRLYDDFARASGLDKLEIIATSAARDAQNAAEFLELARKHGLPPFRVLSGEQEAQLGVLAVANSFELDDAWVMDLGGGSAQISLMRHRLHRHGQAYPLGAVRLTDQFLHGDPPRRAEVEALEDWVRQQLAPVVEQMRQNPIPLVAMGGTIRNFGKIDQKARDFPLDRLHGYFLDRKTLESILEEMLQRTTEKRADLPGLQADRADTIMAGGLVYRCLLREANLEGVWLSGQGVREGAFYQHFLPAPHLIPHVRQFSVQNLFAHYPQQQGHTQRVQQFCQQLFRDLSSLHSYGEAEERLLLEAALLHDIGMELGYYDHHKHGEYLIRSSTLPAVSPREQALLALLVRYHRKGDPKPSSYRNLLQHGDDRLLLRLTALLRIAEYLERSRSGRVRGLQLTIEADKVRLMLQAPNEPWVELVEVRKQQSIFRKAFGRNLEVTWQP
jgi:exopolyphosphatase/guanosine-5'-triphosphate,3'-diphosphate pyrophosphatase